MEVLSQGSFGTSSANMTRLKAGAKALKLLSQGSRRAPERNQRQSERNCTNNTLCVYFLLLLELSSLNQCPFIGSFIRSEVQHGLCWIVC